MVDVPLFTPWKWWCSIVFGCFWYVYQRLPGSQALMLPDQLQHPPSTASSSVRGRMAQLLTVWCAEENGRRLSQVVRRRWGWGPGWMGEGKGHEGLEDNNTNSITNKNVYYWIMTFTIGWWFGTMELVVNIITCWWLNIDGWGPSEYWWLVGGDWNHGILWLTIYLGNVMIPTDELFHIFQRGRYTTNQFKYECP